MIRRPPSPTPLYSSAASDVYKRQLPQLALLPTCQGGNRLRVVGLPLDEREGLEYGVVEVRCDVGARVGEQLLLAGDRESGASTVSYTHLRAHETGRNLVC